MLVPLHILHPFEEAIASSKSAAEAESNSALDCGALSIPSTFNSTLRRIMRMAAEHVCKNPFELGTIMPQLQTIRMAYKLNTCTPDYYGVCPNSCGFLVDYDIHQLQISVVDMEPLWWSVDESDILRFNTSPSKEHIKGFLLGFVRSTMSVRFPSHNFLNLTNPQQVDSMGINGLGHVVLYGKAKNGQMQVVRDVLAEYSGVKGLGWIKHNINPKHAVSMGTVKYGQHEMRSEQASGRRNGHLEL